MAAQLNGPDDARVRILLVDDDEPSRYATSRVLRRAGFDVLEGATAADALRLAADEPDLVVLDVCLPDMSGLEVCRRLKANAATASIMVLQTSATYVRGEHRTEGLEAGADAYLPAPFEPGELLANVEALLRIRRAERAMQARAEQQAAVAALGQLALAGAGLARLTGEAASEVARVLGVDLVEVLELTADGTAARLEAGVGWREGLVGRATVPTGSASQAGYTLLSTRPVVVEDLASEVRFSQATLLREHAVTSGATVVVYGAERPYGVLGAHSRRRRQFTGDDVHFLQAVANVLGAAAERRRAEAERDALLARERQARAEAELAVRLRDEFLARASHELRTPLTIISAHLALLARRDPAVPGGHDDLIRIARRHADQMVRLIGDLLDASRLELAGVQLSTEPVDLKSVVAEAIDQTRSLADAKDVALLDAVSPGERVVADRLKLEQVLLNLVVNAIKHTPGGGAVEVSLLADGDAVEIRVRDTGEGIAREHLERVFEPFFQVGSASGRRKASGRGSGLGLAIVRRLVEVHGGRVWAESDGPGRGSTFRVRLPRGHAAARPA